MSKCNMKEVSAVLDKMNIKHKLVIAHDIHDGGTAEEIFVLMMGIKSHLSSGMHAKRLNEDERERVFNLDKAVDELVARLKMFRYRANLERAQIQEIMIGLTNVMRNINMIRTIVDKDRLDKCAKLVSRSRDLLMNYGVRSRQPSSVGSR